MDDLNRLRSRDLHVDLIRTTAMVGVILFHAAGQWLITSQEFNQLNPLEITCWAVVDIYQAVGVISVPIFLMLTGALLLQPQKKDESLRVFFKKRWARIGLPFFFWAAVYFIWDFFVQKIPFSADVIFQGLLNGAYTQFWYIYVLVGLYLLTPLLRALLANADRALMKYFVTLWVMGVAILPFLGLLSPFRLNSNVFAVGGYVGFFVLGTYLTTVKLRRSIIGFFLLLGVALTAFGTYVLAATGGWENMYFFQEYISPTVILAAVMMFLLLLTVKPPAQQEINPSKGSTLIKVISANTLPIFFLHVIVLESIQNGYFGFALNRNILNPIIEIPLKTVIVLFATLGIVLLLKKVPYLSKLVG
ncbi:MAG: acyltransferase family protein [Candidatus Bathyarchaeota archaeon]|nr:acyltransferase family protein [Candidatus Bathyarchaeota archaeon]